MTEPGWIYSTASIAALVGVMWLMWKAGRIEERNQRLQKFLDEVTYKINAPHDINQALGEDHLHKLMRGEDE